MYSQFVAATRRKKATHVPAPCIERSYVLVCSPAVKSIAYTQYFLLMLLASNIFCILRVSTIQLFQMVNFLKEHIWLFLHILKKTLH